jgi:spore germination protein GerM
LRTLSGSAALPASARTLERTRRALALACWTATSLLACSRTPTATTPPGAANSAPPSSERSSETSAHEAPRPSSSAGERTGGLPTRATRDRHHVQVYFSDGRRDPKHLDCATTYPYSRSVPRTPRVAEAALRELLRGPSEEERANGAETSVPPGTRLEWVRVKDGTARASFSRDLVRGLAGSCRVAALKSQLESTLRAFPTVERVELLVEGQPSEPYFQP